MLLCSPAQSFPRGWGRAAGLIGTLSLHGLVVHATLVGSKLHQHRSPERPAGGAIVAQATPAEELVLLDMTDSPKGDGNLLSQIASLKPKTAAPVVAMQDPDELPQFDVSTEDDREDNSPQSTRDVGDPAFRALMFGRYTHQISARIERAWIRPRTPVNDDSHAFARSTSNDVDENESFVCRVQIRQDSRGDVQEVLLLQCNGTEAWRRSLVVAINQASPMPAPPTPAVFVPNLTMIFEAHAYRVGDPPDAYETEASSNDRLSEVALTPPYHGRTSR